MACDLSAIKAAACTSGIGKEDNSTTLLQIIAQLLCELSSPTAPCENLEGTDSPLNVITPDFEGQVYVQTGGIVWQASSTASSSWTIICEGGGGGADLFLFDSGDTFTFSSTALTSLTIPLWMTDVPFVTISLPNLATSTNYIDIDTCPDLESVDLSSLVSCGDGTSGLYLTSCSSLPSISLPSLVTVDGELYFQTSAALVSFSAPSLVTINGDITADTNPLLTTVTLTSWLPTNGTTIGLDGNALNLASVNHILARCVANAAFVSGSVLLNGGTNAAPAGQGATDVTTLTGRGVTVTHN